MRDPDPMQARLNAKIFSLFALNKAAQILSSVLDLKSLQEMAVDVATEMGGAKTGALYIEDTAGQPYQLVAAKSLNRVVLPPEFSTDVQLVRTAEDPRSRPFLSTISGTGQEALIIPVRLRELPVGFFVLLERANSEPWSADDFEVLETLAAQVAVCLQNARLYRRVIEQYEALEVAQARRIQTEKLAMMGTLLAGVAHELNNPLTVITGHATMLRQTAAGPQATRVEKIAEAAERCARIVRSFLALAREHPPERHSVSLNQVVREAVELLAYQLRVDDVEVDADLAEDIPALWADSHQLHQVIVNLLSNAHHAMRGASVARRIMLSSRYDASRGVAILRVADTGPGVPPDIRSRIFDPFFTTKPTGQGTGLGLSLCQGIVEEHEGSIRLESAPGRGAVFVIELPVKPAPVPARNEAPADAKALGGRSVLVVDDEPDVRDVLADLLSADGHEVDTAPNGAVALQMMHEKTYSLVLTDTRMPEMDGLTLYRELERIYPHMVQRFIMVTGDALSHETRQFMEQTQSATVSKPFTLDEIRRVVHRVLASGEGTA